MDQSGDYMKVFVERTPQRSAVKSTYLQKCVSFGSTKKGLSYDDGSMAENTIQFSDDRMETVRSHGNETDCTVTGIFELDTSRYPVSSFSKTTFTPDSAKNNFNTTVLLDIDDPGACFTDTLYEEFLQVFLGYSGEQEVFSLLLNYEELCCNYIEQLSKIVKKSACAETRFSKTTMMLRHMQMERNTWRLLRTLFQDRLERENIDEGEMLMDMLGKRLSDKQIVDNLYMRDSYIRQSQLIVDWLEKNAADDFKDTYFDRFEYFTDHCLSLEHTLNKQSMQLDKSPLFEMDPDASVRNKNSILHEADKENEARLLKYMFICIRAGNLDQAQLLAERFGEPWLAAALEGWRLFHDPNYDQRSTPLLPVEGNKYRDIWKAACWGLSQETSLYEQAIYGSLSGNLKAVLPACNTWQDHLWAYLRTLLDKRIEQEIRQDRALQELPIDYWDKMLDLEQIFQELQAIDSKIVQMEGKSHYHIIQKYVILDDLDGLVEEMHSWLQREFGGHVLRCVVHVLLFLRVIGRSTKEELCVPILEAYVQELIGAHKVSLVAPYVATLPKELQVVWYGKFLEGVEDTAERQKCLQYAEDAGLDVPRITRTVVTNIREREPPASDTTQQDVQKIRAIDWLIFDPAQRAEALKQGNALMRMFVAQRKMEAAKEVFSKIPADSVGMLVLKRELSAEDDNATREYLCFKAYLEANEAFSSWFEHSVHGRPQEPAAPAGDTFREQVAHEHERQQHARDLQRWHKVVTSLGHAAADSLYNVLLFVNGGWMVDQRTDGPVDEVRVRQLSCLRKLCLPHVTRLLQDLLISEERFQEAITLANYIASESYLLYKEFSTEDLERFLHATLDSAYHLLDRSLDPLGHGIDTTD